MVKEVVLSCFALLTGCSTGDRVSSDMASMGHAGSDMAIARASDLAPGPDMTPAYPFTTVITILLENHDYKEIVGNTTDAPYINSLIQSYGLATNYKDVDHPSLPNYVYMVSGNLHHELESDNDASTYLANGGKLLDDDNLGNQLQTAHIPWRGYFQSMFLPCQLSDTGNRVYAARHNPFIYFNNILFGANQLCTNVDVDYSSFAADLSAGTYRYMWISPDAWNDGHGVIGNEDPKAMLKISDDWCKKNVQPILDSAIFKAGGVIFLTWDEAEARNGDDPDQVPMIVISPKIKSAGFTSNKPYTHASYLATVEDIFGLPRLGEAASAQNMMEFFQ
jgi:phosphatidylinositol-3-phosphatase